MAEKKFEPFVKPEEKMREMTLKAVLLGAILGILFCCIICLSGT